jgi:predicted dehydrogenase
MDKKYKVCIIGFGHMHVNDVAAYFSENPRTDVVAVADTVPDIPELRIAPYTRGWNMDFCQKKFHIDKKYTDYREMLDREKPDLALVYSENIKHLEITRECAVRKINVSVEKPMAVSLSEALEMVRIARIYNIRLIINWPVVWLPELHLMNKMIGDHVIGNPLQFRIRTSHTGPLGAGAKHKGVTESAEPMTESEKGMTWWHQSKSGGGAMLDFCCYGSMLSCWLLKQKAIAVAGMRSNLNSTWGSAEDSAYMLVRFDKAVASIETSWVTFQEPFGSNGPVVYGTEGTITVVEENGQAQVKVFHADGSVKLHKPEPLPYKYQNLSCAFVHHMDTGESLHETLSPELNVEAMAVLDAGIRSSESNKTEICNNWCWQIG